MAGGLGTTCIWRRQRRCSSRRPRRRWPRLGSARTNWTGSARPCGRVSGLAIAARLAAAGKTILFVTVELCSTSIRLDKLTKANLVATALFGDGAAACAVRGGEGGIAQLGAGAEIRGEEAALSGAGAPTRSPSPVGEGRSGA